VTECPFNHTGYLLGAVVVWVITFVSVGVSKGLSGKFGKTRKDIFDVAGSVAGASLTAGVLWPITVVLAIPALFVFIIWSRRLPR
jgi:hypothetical protein